MCALCARSTYASTHHHHTATKAHTHTHNTQQMSSVSGCSDTGCQQSYKHIQPSSSNTRAASILPHNYCGKHTAASILLHDYCCKHTAARILPQAYCCSCHSAPSSCAVQAHFLCTAEGPISSYSALIMKCELYATILAMIAPPSHAVNCGVGCSIYSGR